MTATVLLDSEMTLGTAEAVPSEYPSEKALAKVRRMAADGVVRCRDDALVDRHGVQIDRKWRSRSHGPWVARGDLFAAARALGLPVVDAVVRRPMMYPGGVVARGGIHGGVLVAAVGYPALPAIPPSLAFEAHTFEKIRDAATYSALVAALAAPLVVEKIPFIAVHAGAEEAGNTVLDVASAIARGHACRPLIAPNEVEGEVEDDLES